MDPQPARTHPRQTLIDQTTVQLAARAHRDAARVAEARGQVRSAPDYRAFSFRVRQALRRLDVGAKR